jgi:hypothetical protein
MVSLLLCYRLVRVLVPFMDKLRVSIMMTASTLPLPTRAEGEGYRIAGLPTNSAQAEYPFLYLLVLSLIWELDPKFPENCSC